MDEIGEKRETSHEMIVRVWRARKINHVFGSQVVTPWNVDDLSEDWLEVFDSLYEFETRERDVQNAEQRAKQEYERVLAAKRANHPSYRKYLS